MRDDFIVIPSGSLAVISFDIIEGAIVLVDCFSRCIFAPESAIDSMLLLGEFGGSPIKFINVFRFTNSNFINYCP